MSSLFVFTLQDFVRSPWVFLNLLVLVGVQVLFYNYAPGQSHFYGVEYTATSLLAAVTTAVLFTRANRAETYPILARPVPYALYTGAILLVAWLVALAGHALSSLAVVLRFGSPLVAGAEPLSWLRLVTDPNGNLAIAVAAAFTVGLIALLSPFVSSSGVRLSILALLALFVMSFDNRNFPIENLRPWMQTLPPFLAPVAGTLKFATQVPPDNVARLSLLVLAVYAFLVLALALMLSASRELILD